MPAPNLSAVPRREADSDAGCLIKKLTDPHRPISAKATDGDSTGIEGTKALSVLIHAIHPPAQISAAWLADRESTDPRHPRRTNTAPEAASAIYRIRALTCLHAHASLAVSRRRSAHIPDHESRSSAAARSQFAVRALIGHQACRGSAFTADQFVAELLERPPFAAGLELPELPAVGRLRVFSVGRCSGQ